ncbi:ABC transporter substrate-binding protein [Aliikangiella sp. G2MR2-5]|uniref:ABC transporter substrate-binding protein n=1 Tax=Aliikangiella sp. G2MR2-5 TaxID=2788943 RepID=UPI0018AB28D4
MKPAQIKSISSGDGKLRELSLKELIHIPLNKGYSHHTIHQSATNPINDTSVNFGIMAPISEFPVYSAEIIAAADMAANFVNQNGGIDGRRLVILRADDKENTPVSARLARELVDKYRVEAIIGPATSNSVVDVLQQVTIPNNIPLITQSASSMVLTDIGGKHAFWRMVANNQQQLDLMTDFIHKKSGHRRIFLITGRDIYSQEIASGLKAYFSEVSNGWVEHLAISDLVHLGGMDLLSEIKMVQKQKATAVIITLTNAQVKDMIKKIRRHWLGKYPLILVGDTVTPKYLIDSNPGDISACIFSFVGTQQDMDKSLSLNIAEAITTKATGFDGAYIYDSTMIMAMAKVLAKEFDLSTKEAVNLIASDGYPINYSDFPKIIELYRQHKKFSYTGFSGRVLFDELGNNLTAYAKIYSIAEDPAESKKACVTP